MNTMNPVPGNNTPLLQQFMQAMKAQASTIESLQAKMEQVLQQTCNPGGGSSSVPGGSGTPGGTPGGCIPIPTSMNSWCPVKCDPCLFGNLQLDMELYPWPNIDAQLWDTDTKISDVVTGAFPLAPGGTLTLQQEARRTLQYVPEYVTIASTWTGASQPGLLTYQWQSAIRPSPGTPVQFSNPQKGNQYECGDNCIKVPFPSYKGCTGFPIGSQGLLQLQVSLDPAATSTLTSLTVVVYHRKSRPGNDGCDLRNGSCGGGCGCG